MLKFSFCKTQQLFLKCINLQRWLQTLLSCSSSEAENNETITTKLATLNKCQKSRSKKLKVTNKYFIQILMMVYIFYVREYYVKLI